jgi:hypothetical protein
LLNQYALPVKYSVLIGYDFLQRLSGSCEMSQPPSFNMEKPKPTRRDCVLPQWPTPISSSLKCRGISNIRGCRGEYL